MTDNEQLRRIAQYEDMLREAEALLPGAAQSARNGLRWQRSIEQAAYACGGGWGRDGEAGEAGVFAGNVPRGVLSEFGIDRLLEAFGELLAEGGPCEAEPAPPIGTKLVVLGCPGSGKSVFSLRLGEKTGLPLIHLDNIWWRSDRTHITREEFDRRLAEILRTEAWILDGYYNRSCELRIRACDTVFFLDYSEEICMRGITERVGTRRPDMPWTEQALDPELVELVRRFHSEMRPALLALLARYPEKQLLRFRARAEADAWLAAL